MAEAAPEADGVGADDAAAAAAPPEKTPEEIKAEEQKAAMLAMAAAAAQAAAAEASKRQKKGRGKKKKGSWDLLAPMDRQTRFWVEQFGRDSAAGNAEAAKFQRVVDKKTEENRIAKQNWENEVKRMLKFLYQMDKKVEDTRTGGSQAIKDLKQKVAEKKAKYEKYWADALSLDPYEELVVDHSIGRTLSFVVLAQIAQPWGQLTEKLDIATKELEQLTHFKEAGQYENEKRIGDLESEVEALLDDLEANHDFLEALMDKMKRRGLKRIARQADEAKHAAAQKLLWLLSPADQEEIKNHAWFRAERRAFQRDADATTQEVDDMEAETLQLLTRVLKEEEERLLEDVGKLEEEVGEEGMKKRGGAGGGKTEEKVEDEVKTKKRKLMTGSNSSLNNISLPTDVEVTSSALEVIKEEEASQLAHFRDANSPSDRNGKQKNDADGQIGDGSYGNDGDEDVAKKVDAVKKNANSEEKKNGDKTKMEQQKEEEKDPYRPPCALPYDVPERLARAVAEMQRVCRANTTNIRNPNYVVHGKPMTIRGAAQKQTKAMVEEQNHQQNAPSSTSSRNEFGGIKKKWPVTAKMMNAILPPWDPRKKPPKDEAPRNFRLANGRKPWDPSVI